MRTWITQEPIDVDQVLSRVGTPADGAVLLFLGTVRDHNDGRRVRGMRYEAYVAMADRVLREIAEEASVRAATDRIAAVHRIGELAVGEISVAIAISSPHRAEAFEGGRWIIEEIKRRLPVWKEEHYIEGSRRWLEGHEVEVGNE